MIGVPFKYLKDLTELQAVALFDLAQHLPWMRDNMPAKEQAEVFRRLADLAEQEEWSR